MKSISRKSMFTHALVLSVMVAGLFLFGCGGGGKVPADTLLDQYDSMVTEMEKSATGSGSPEEMANKAMEQSKKLAEFSTKFQEELKKLTPDEIKTYTDRFNAINARMMKVGAGS